MLRIHQLKIQDPFLDSLISGDKKAEIRLNDRDYQVGDVLRFKRGENLYLYIITHIQEFPMGLRDGYVVLSVEKYREVAGEIVNG